ncbi:SDR family oxidoreductase [Pseudonocardia ailaonensis]|uniref:SDR family oxidoreductase n=1 Tax=Pseudonocardia ailaonensis TaxID=367279 RepID=A0ABN2NAX4_9PSEU
MSVSSARAASREDVSRGLAGRRILVLGAGGGQGSISAAVVAALSCRSAGLVLADVDERAVVNTAEELARAGAVASGTGCDVTSTASIDAAVRHTVRVLGGIDGLVTVVGGMGRFAPMGPLHLMTDEQIDRVLALNLRYVFSAVRAVLPPMMAGGGGSIVSIGSLSGQVSAPNHSVYGAAKAGLAHLARTTTIEYGPSGVRMNIVAPGLVATPAAGEVLSSDTAGGMRNRIPLGRPATAADIGNAVAFLVSDAAAYVSGQTLVVDGGATARFPLAD